MSSSTEIGGLRAHTARRPPLLVSGTSRGRFYRLGVSFLLAALAAATPALAAPERLVPVSSVSQLRSALLYAKTGDVIELADGTYDPGTTPFAIQFVDARYFTIRAAHSGLAVIDGGPTSCSTESRLFTHPVGNTSVIFEGLVFRDGCTLLGGTSAGVDIRNANARATFVDCQFLNNNARTTGASAGAVLVTDGAQVQFVGSRFDGNTTRSHGGAILAGQGSTVFVHDSVFSGNRNNVSGHVDNALGGAIHIFNGAAGTTSRLYVSNSRFEANQGGFAGGAIMAKGSFASPTAPSLVLIANSTFNGNFTDKTDATHLSPLEGGAVMVEDNVRLEVYYSRFTNNAADQGGAIASYRGDVFVRSSEFRYNAAVEGLGGAIKAHSNDSCAETNLPSAVVNVADSFFDGDSAKFGGAIYVAGDTVRAGYPSQGCNSGTPAANRALLTVTRTAFHACHVEYASGQANALGGAIYGDLVDSTVSDSLFLDSSANAGASPNTVAGGAAAFLLNSKIRFSGSTFGRNSAWGQGGAIFLWGGVIANFSDNVFFENAVVFNGGAASQSFGAALFTQPDIGWGLDVSGAVTTSTFTDNDGTAIYEIDGNGRRNLVTYSNNAFHETSFGSDVFFSFYNPGGPASQWDVSELNTLSVVGVDKGAGNSASGSTITTAALLATPPQILPAGAAGDPPGITPAYLAWAWSGGCGRLQGGSPLAATGVQTPGTGSYTLQVFDGDCGTGVDASAAASITNAGGPSTALAANPTVINGGQTSDLSWSLSGAPFLAGVVTHGVADALPSGTGGSTVMPPATARFRLLLLTQEGGAVETRPVFVDEPGDEVIFLDDFESGNTSAWN